MKSASQMITEFVSNNTTVDLYLLREDDNYRAYLNEVKSSGMTFNQCVDQMTNWVNNNY
jgi:hypothetical protein